MPLKILWVREETRRELLREAQRRDRKVNGSLADEMIMTGLRCLSAENRKGNGSNKQHEDFSSFCDSSTYGTDSDYSSEQQGG